MTHTARPPVDDDDVNEALADAASDGEGRITAYYAHHHLAKRGLKIVAVVADAAAPGVPGVQIKLDAVRREIAMRRRVYPRRVAEKKMTQEKADHEIAVMEAIAADYEAKTERLL